METLTTHPATAQQARAFTAPGSLSFPSNGLHDGALQKPAVASTATVTVPGSVPTKPVDAQAADAVGAQNLLGVSGIVPTLQ